MRSSLAFSLLSLLWALGCLSCRHNPKPPPSIVKTNEPIRIGHATYFDSLGLPAGGCGVPEKNLETPQFLALNVQQTPGDYTSYPVRPMRDARQVGIWDNGLNCGRWVRVKLAKNCVDGVNSGLPGSEFCKGGRYEDDAMSGASADFIVTDSCQDGNRWCRDDAFHLDLATSSLRNFSKDGQRIADVRGKAGWSNRLVEWQFIDAPNYQGDLEIGFIKNAQVPYWPAILITRLQRGLHSVELEVGGRWKAMRMNSDNGQSYILEGSPPYRLRFTDAYDQPINEGRNYILSFPCKGICTADYTKASYQVEASKDAVPPASVRISVRLADEANGPAQAPPTATPPPPPSPSPSAPAPPSSNSFKASLRLKDAASNSACFDVMLSNEGSERVDAWSLLIDTQGGVIDQKWNLSVTPQGASQKLESGSQWTQQLAPGQKLENLGFCMSGNAKMPIVLKVQP